MIDKLKFSYTEQYKTNIVFAFLLSFIVFQPVLKYFEYVLLFPRINYSVVIIVMFSLYLLAIDKDFIKKYPLDLMFPFLDTCFCFRYPNYFFALGIVL